MEITYIDVNFQLEDQKFEPSFPALEESFGVNFGMVQPLTKYVGGEPYAGDYVVTPKVVEQVLPTKDKVLVDDITIKEVPVFRVSNTSGGTTVYIAKEV